MRTLDVHQEMAASNGADNLFLIPKEKIKKSRKVGFRPFNGGSFSRLLRLCHLRPHDRLFLVWEDVLR